VRADHVGVDGEGVAVAGGVVHDDVDAQLLLEEDGHRQRRHAHLGRRAVTDVDGVDAGVPQQARAGHGLLRLDAVRRVDLDRHHEAPGLDLLPEGRLDGGHGRGGRGV